MSLRMWVHWLLADALVETELFVARQTWRALVQVYGQVASRGAADQALWRLKRKGLIAAGNASAGTFQVTASGRRQAIVGLPTERWNLPWDGSWRAVIFDLPETRRHDRRRLWKALRAHRLGLLQRSVWIWPMPLEAILQDMVVAQGVPECFCGLETRRVFLCSDAELVATAWDWVEIGRRQQAHLQSTATALPSLAKTTDLHRLAALGRAEWIAYEHAFSFDPLLPRVLWPVGYRGEDVQQKHVLFRRRFRQRLHEIALLAET